MPSFAKKKAFSQIILKKVVKYTQNISFFANQLSYIPPISFTVISKHYKFLVKKIIINFRVTNHFFVNYAYFSTYKKYYHKFKTGSGKIFIAHEYRNIVLCLAYPDSSEVTWTYKKMSLAILFIRT